MNLSPRTPAGSSDFDLEKGRQSEVCEDCNVAPKEVPGSEKVSEPGGCEVHNADPKEVLVWLQSILHNGTSSRLRRSYQILQLSMLKVERVAEASISARVSQAQRQDTIWPYQRAVC